MWEALREAVDEEMEKDPDVCVIGMVLEPLIEFGVTGTLHTRWSNCWMHCRRGCWTLRRLIQGHI